MITYMYKGGCALCLRQHRIEIIGVAAGQRNVYDLCACCVSVRGDRLEGRPPSDKLLSGSEERRRGDTENFRRSAAGDHLLRLDLMQIGNSPDQRVVIEIGIAICPAERLLHYGNGLRQRSVGILIAVQKNGICARGPECRFGTHRLCMPRRLESFERSR